MGQEASVLNRNTLTPYRKALSLYLRSTLKMRDFTYKDLVVSLADKGVQLDETNLRNKFSRGAIAGDLLLLILDILKVSDDAFAKIQELINE